jgi:hypothetical protein
MRTIEICQTISREERENERMGRKILLKKCY